MLILWILLNVSLHILLKPGKAGQLDGMHNSDAPYRRHVNETGVIDCTCVSLL